MFNIKDPDFGDCSYHSGGNRVYNGHSSYVYSVKWSDFAADVDKYIDIAYEIRSDLNAYEIVKKLA